MKARAVRVLLWVLLFLSLSANLHSLVRLDDRAQATPIGRPASLNSFSIRYSDSSFDRPPNESDLVIQQEEDAAYLDDVLKTALNKTASSSDEAKCIQLLKYIASSMADTPNDGSATKMMRDGFALCGGKSYSFIILCRKAGLPARYVGTMYMSTISSHSISEVFYADKWHLYDPTFGIFFYSKADYDRAGYVISFHDLVSNPEKWTAFKVVPKAGAGKYDDRVRAFPITRVEREPFKSSKQGKLVGQEKREKRERKLVSRYRKEINEAYPVAYGSDDLVSYPVDANLLQVKSRWYGQVDNSNQELGLYQKRFSGSHYLGSAVPPAFHSCLVKAPPNTTVTVEYYSQYPNPPKLSLVPLRAAKLIACKYEDKKVIFTVYLNDSEAIFSIYSPTDIFLIDAMRIYR